jgi:cobalt-zinc-cadmium efflux system protein
VILEATPRDVDIMKMIEALKKVEGVKDVHDIHVWSITPELRAMNGHILIEDISTSDAATIRSRIEEVIKDQFLIEHTTLQMECQKCNPADLFCKLTENNNSDETHKNENKHLPGR